MKNWGDFKALQVKTELASFMPEPKSNLKEENKWFAEGFELKNHDILYFQVCYLAEEEHQKYGISFGFQ